MIADIVVAAVLLISGVLALFRGFVKETLTIGGWIGAIFITLYGYPHLAPLLTDVIAENWVAEIVAAAALFLTTLVILTIVSHMIAKHVQGSMLGHLDRALGFVFGLVRGMALVAMVYLGGTLFWDENNLPDEIHKAKSLPLVKVGADFLASLMPEDTFPGRNDASDRIDDTVNDLKESVQDAVEGVARDKLEEMVDELGAEEKLRRLNDPEPETKTEPALPPGELPPPPGYEEEERSDMQRLIENNQ